MYYNTQAVLLLSSCIFMFHADWDDEKQELEKTFMELLAGHFL